jgi:PBP1b-binding outer membrane lipoprotein LpoB
MRYLILILLLCSCSAKWHYKKAIKKGLEITTKTDTIRITTIDSIPVIQHDTIVYQKFFTSKDTVIYYKDVYVPKTIREIRIENKLIRDTIRIKERANVQIAKEERKQTNVFSKFFVGLAIGLSIALMLYFANKLKR